MIKYVKNSVFMALAIVLFSASCGKHTASLGMGTGKNDLEVANDKGEHFTFHRDGTASVKGLFGENIGTFATNSDYPEDYAEDNVQLVKKGKERRVFVGQLGLKGGMGTAPKKDKHKYKEYWPITSYHISCQSDRPNVYDPCRWGLSGENLGGVVLYKYGNKDDWYLNGVHCRTGYIILKKTAGLEARVRRRYKLGPLSGQTHGAVYASVFGRDIDDKVVGTGFAYYGTSLNNKTWRYRSQSLNNKSDGYHLVDGAMGTMEAKWVSAAVRSWIIGGTQNTRVTDDFGFVKPY